jgi:hypothetical protein
MSDLFFPTYGHETVFTIGLYLAISFVLIAGFYIEPGELNKTKTKVYITICWMCSGPILMITGLFACLAK